MTSDDATVIAQRMIPPHRWAIVGSWVTVRFHHPRPPQATKRPVGRSRMATWRARCAARRRERMEQERRSIVRRRARTRAGGRTAMGRPASGVGSWETPRVGHGREAVASPLVDIRPVNQTRWMILPVRLRVALGAPNVAPRPRRSQGLFSCSPNRTPGADEFRRVRSAGSRIGRPGRASGRRPPHRSPTRSEERDRHAH